MKIEYRTKEESNREQEAEFLALSGHERFMRFLEISRQVMRFTTKHPEDEDNGNFVVRRKQE